MTACPMTEPHQFALFMVGAVGTFVILLIVVWKGL